MCALANSEDPDDEMLHEAAFHHDLHYLLSFRERYTLQFLFGKYNL